MTNQTAIQWIMETQNLTEREALQQIAFDHFLPSVVVFVVVWILLTLIVGFSTVKKDRDKFWGIFILTFVIAGIILFFTFAFPVIPQLVAKLGFT